jgi:hypothetical protein
MSAVLIELGTHHDRIRGVERRGPFRPMAINEWARIERAIAARPRAPIRPVNDPDASAERPASWSYTWMQGPAR